METNTVHKEREFRYEELFFSITDFSGRILAANEIFTRVSAFEEQELIGQPHNIIRHPDMPKAVFKLFWDTISAHKPIVAYVKNRAKTGEFYWVLAFAFPCDGGYLSIRLKPGGPLFKPVQELYKTLLEEEKKMIAELGQRRGIERTVTRLLEELQELGFSSYEDFMWTAMEQEIRHRDSKILIAEQKEDVLHVLFEGMSGYKMLNAILRRHTEQFLQFSRSIRLLSMNLDIGSSQLSSNGKSLSVIATNLQVHSKEGEQYLNKIIETLHGLNHQIGELMLDSVTVRLQKQMHDYYKTEIGASHEETDLTNRTAELLKKTYSPLLMKVPHHLKSLFGLFQELENGLAFLRKFLRVLQFTQTMAYIESARIPESGGFKNLFDDLSAELERSEKSLQELHQQVSKTHYEQASLRKLHQNSRMSFAMA